MARQPDRTQQRQVSNSASSSKKTRITWDSIPPWVYMTLFVVTYCAIIGYVSFVHWTVGGYVVETDALQSYLPDAAGILEGRFTTLDGFKGPGYHLAVAALGLLIPKLFWAAKVIAIGSAAVVLVVVFRLVHRTIGTAAAWVTMLLVAVNAQFVLYTVQIGTDMYFLAVATVTGALLLDKRTWKTALAAGACAGFAYITRYNGLFLIVAGLPIMLLADRAETSWRDRLIRTGVFLGAAFIVILPWSLFTWSEGVGFFYNNNHKNVAYEVYGRGVVGWDQFWQYMGGSFSSYREVMTADFGLFVTTMLKNSVVHIYNDVMQFLSSFDVSSAAGPADHRPFDRPVSTGHGMITVLLWGAALISGIALAVREYRWKAWPAILLGLMSYGILIPVFYSVRFSLPMLPFYAALAGVAVHLIGKLLADNIWKKDEKGLLKGRLAASGGILILAALNVTAAHMATGKLLESAPAGIDAIADVLKDRVEPGSRMLARKPHLPYHTGIDFARIPIIRDINELPAIAQQRHAKYLYVSGIEAALRPPLAPLRDARNASRYSFLRPLIAMRGTRPAAVYEFTIDIPPPVDESGPKHVPLRRKPAQVPALIRLAEGYSKAGADSLARARIREVLTVNPDEPSAHLLLLKMELAQVSAPLHDPNSQVPQRVAALQVKRNMDGRFAELAERFPASRAVQLGVGDVFYSDNRYQQAIAAYSRAFELDTTDVALMSRLGNLYLGIRDFTSATESFRRLLNADPYDSEAYGAAGGAFAALGDLDNAISYLQTSVDMDSTKITVRSTLAQSYQAAGQMEDAARQWQGILSDPRADDLDKAQARQALGLPPDPSLMP